VLYCIGPHGASLDGGRGWLQPRNTYSKYPHAKDNHRPDDCLAATFLDFEFWPSDVHRNLHGNHNTNLPGTCKSLKILFKMAGGASLGERLMSPGERWCSEMNTSRLR
jgi:hypothetical protein